MRPIRTLVPLVACGALAAQNALDVDAKRDVGPPLSAAVSNSVFVVDFDRDGRRDLLFGAEYSFMYIRREALRRNLGDGRFSPVAASRFLGWFDARAVADLDGDGTDEVLGDDLVQRIAPDGSIRSIMSGLGAGAAAVGDVDGDGDLDVVRGMGLELYLQSGPLVFARSNGLAGATGSALSLADFDADGDLDLLVARDGAACGLYLNDGRGVFADASNRLPAGARHATACALGDLDGDGDLDALILCRSPDPSWLLYQAGGALVDVSARLPLPVGDHTGFALGDVDGDGVLDVAVASRPGGAILRGTSNGWFVELPGAWPEPHQSGCVTLVDVDADGDLDLVDGGVDSNDRVHFNDGRGHFTGASSSRPHLPWGGWRRDRYAVMADFDLDGDLDVVGPGTFWRNDGFGRFDALPGTAPSLPSEFNIVAPRPAVGDVDGDRQLDLVVPSAFDRFRVFRGDGRGGFLPGAEFQAPVSPDSMFMRHQAVTVLALHDLDGDGDLDLLCGASQQDAVQPAAPARDSLWRNDGRGVFVQDTGWCPTGEQFGKDVEFGDMNGDGRPDFTDGYGVFLQRADGRFDYVPPDPAGWLYGGGGGGVALGDLDGDGDLDVVEAVACYGTPWCEGEPDVVGWNDGAGVLRRARFTNDQESRDVALLDADGDGDLDVFVARVDNGSHGIGPDELWLADGAQSLRQATYGIDLPEVWCDSWVVLSGDVDADGDVDLLTLDANGPQDDARIVVWTNMTRHLRAPDLLRIGRPYALELHGVVRAGLVLGAPCLARVPLPPFGVLGLSPDAAVTFATFGAPTTGRRADLELRVPPAPALVGARYAFQGAVVDGAGQLRLTNRVVETFLGN